MQKLMECETLLQSACGMHAVTQDLVDDVKELWSNNVPVDHTAMRKDMVYVLCHVQKLCDVFGWTLEDLVNTQAINKSSRDLVWVN